MSSTSAVTEIVRNDPARDVENCPDNFAKYRATVILRVIGTTLLRVPIANIPGYRNFCDATLARSSGVPVSPCAPPHIVSSRRTAVQDCIISCSCYGTFEYVLGDNSIYPRRMRIHLMTIKVFTAPRRTPQFEIWRLGSPVYRQSETPLSRTVVLPLPSLFRPLSTAVSFFLFRIPFPVSLYTFGGVPPPRRRGPQPPYTAVFHIIYNSRPARCPRNNSARIRERASVSPNWWKPYEAVVTCPVCDNSE